jgi:hypothetical protein
MEAEDRVKLDRVPRHTRLTVLEVEKRNTCDLRAATEPN